MNKDITVAEITQEIWERFRNPLRQFIRKRVPDNDASEDILQNVFVKIHQHIHELHDKSKLQAWIYQITQNAIVDFYRSHKELTTAPDTIEELADDSDHDNEPGEALSRCLKPIIDHLPDPYREALLLTELEGLTQQEMGKKLGLSVSGAKSRIQRGRAKLKDMLLNCCHIEFDRFGNVLDYQPIDQPCRFCPPTCPEK